MGTFHCGFSVKFYDKRIDQVNDNFVWNVKGLVEFQGDGQKL